MAKKSTLKLCYIIMAEDGRIWLDAKHWGSPDGNDMVDAQTFLARRQAERVAKSLDVLTSIFEIGLHNGRPVMLVDAYEYWLDAKYHNAKRKNN
jgi:hypothetical protein